MKTRHSLILCLILLCFTKCTRHSSNINDEIIEHALQKVYPTIYENVDSADMYLHSAAPFVNEASELYRNKYLLAEYQVKTIVGSHCNLPTHCKIWWSIF